MRDLNSLPLVKAHAYGNDFLLIPAHVVSQVDDLPALARRACDRHRGVGGDGLMVVEQTTTGARTRLFNSDGSQAEVSGNGVRCAAAWIARTRKLLRGATLVIETVAGPKRLVLLEIAGCQYTFRAEMGPPTDVHQESLTVGGEAVTVVVLRVGNPQCVVLGPVTEERLHRLGAGLTKHPYFPEGTNVELASVESPGRVRILIWERGVGPTESSGTGTCAAAVAAAAYGGANRSVEVIAPGGTQHVEWTSNEILLTGWAETTAAIDWWSHS